MVTAIILLHVERTKINEVAEQIAAMEGVSAVYSVSGIYDLVAMVRVASDDALSELVTHKLLAVEHIQGTEMMLAFRTYSRHDLESMFFA
jgi:DNA-binding Lrp family transcriptional regulator